MTAPAPWPRSILPAARDPLVWNPWMDGIAKLYPHVHPGERPAGMAMTLIDGIRTSVLVLKGNGEIRRLTVTEDVTGKAGAA